MPEMAAAAAAGALLGRAAILREHARKLAERERRGQGPAGRKVSAASNGLAAGPANALACVNHETNLQMKKRKFKIN